MSTVSSSQRRVSRVLVVDDDPDIVDLLTINLETHGYEVMTAFDGEEAMAQVASAQPDLIVLDVMMPRKDGYEVLADLRAAEDTRDIPVVMLTAKASDADMWSGWEAGADYYVTKPFDLGELMRFIGFLQVDTDVPS
jgi:DNA-binding response OmpR family regulator